MISIPLPISLFQHFGVLYNVKNLFTGSAIFQMIHDFFPQILDTVLHVPMPTFSTFNVFVKNWSARQN